MVVAAGGARKAIIVDLVEDYGPSDPDEIVEIELAETECVSPRLLKEEMSDVLFFGGNRTITLLNMPAKCVQTDGSAAAAVIERNRQYQDLKKKKVGNDMYAPRGMQTFNGLAKSKDSRTESATSQHAKGQVDSWEIDDAVAAAVAAAQRQQQEAAGQTEFAEEKADAEEAEAESDGEDLEADVVWAVLCACCACSPRAGRGWHRQRHGQRQRRRNERQSHSGPEHRGVCRRRQRCGRTRARSTGRGPCTAHRRPALAAGRVPHARKCTYRDPAYPMMY